MGISEKEAHRRRAAGAGKEYHPAAIIETRVIRSAAFAGLSPSSVVVLLLLAANLLRKDSNGHIQLSEQDAGRHGVERKTLRRALQDLTSHGFIFKTKSGGKVQGHCHKWALTWLPIKRREGLNPAYLERFELFAYENFQGTKRALHSAQNVPLTANRSPKMSLTQGTFSTHKSSITNLGENIAVAAMPRGAWIPAELARLNKIGLGGRQCFAIPRERKPTCH